MPDDWEVAMWPRAEHLHRVFQVRSGDQTGTAFVIDVDGRQYLASALHVVEPSTMTASLDMFRMNAWAPFVVTTVGTDPSSDVAVLALQEQIVRPDLDISMDAGGCAVGQEVFFLGYPLGIRGPIFHPGFPIPIVKRGVVASLDKGGIYVSGSANPGFSGGPVYFAHHQTRKAILTAIIIQALGYEVPVKDLQGNKIGNVVTDSNIVQCSDINSVLSLIKANPIGFQLQPGAATA